MIWDVGLFIDCDFALVYDQLRKKKKKTEWLKQIEFDDLIDYVSLDLLFIFEWGKTGYDSVNQKFIKVEILFFVLVHDSLLHFWIIIILQ